MFRNYPMIVYAMHAIHGQNNPDNAILILIDLNLCDGSHVIGKFYVGTFCTISLY